jgi:hypothetical protein
MLGATLASWVAYSLKCGLTATLRTTCIGTTRAASCSFVDYDNNNKLNNILHDAGTNFDTTTYNHELASISKCEKPKQSV